ncbi:MAG: T9SS C-terminal target domain-containing protein [Cryomorphaceae bacterium]|nr:MAG: T9SS C-terminal target domain-containing protein [Cryomorphaceae bacterium]
MQKSILLALLMSTGLFASAQWVTIPDDNFANKLNELFPECMDGNQMDTQCADVVNATSINVNGSNITELTGIEYFVNLEVLWCSNNNLAYLPELPQLLKHLNCSSNSLTELPALPQSLEGLFNCSNNNLTELPELPPLITTLLCRHNNLYSLPTLPPSLVELECFNNNITTLPELPSSITELKCNDNNLVFLPELPQSLSILRCYNNNLSSLPELPESLTYLRCDNNSLTSIPELPQNLWFLNCDFNNLTSLPDLPNALTSLACNNNNLTLLPELPPSLTYFQCAHNNLTVIPELPQSLLLFDCGGNYLTDLPDLPNSLTALRCQSNELNFLPELPSTLIELLCDSNNILCLPILPVSLTSSNINYFNISNNPFTCLPNYLQAMSGADNSQWLSYPLCNMSDPEGNPYGCSSLDGISGTVYHDINTNCEEDETESGIINVPLNIFNESGDLLATTFTFGNSIYNFAASSGNYTVQLVTENMPFQISCDDPGDSQLVELTANESSALNVDFGVECMSGFDVGVQSVVNTGWAFPGQVHTLNITAIEMNNWYGLQCAQGLSGSVTVNIDGPVTYVGPANNALTPIVSGDLQFTYDIADFSLVNMQQDFNLLLETDTTAQTGDLVCVDIVVTPIDGDFNPANNTYNHCYEVVNSYDPNIKQVWPHDVAPGFDDYFNYTIYFQNTGTAPAFNIRLADTLDTNLDLNTFEVTAYSHPVLTYLHGNVLTFRFNNIMLPDSTTDFEGSIGYVQYRIKAVEGLPVGTVIENTAHIFFDFNEAIVTNTTQNEFVIDTSIDHMQKQLATVFPNPGNGQFNVLFTNYYSGTTHMEVYNLSGQRVMQRQVNENRVVLDLTGYPPGMYLLHLRNEHGSEAVRVVKH